MAPVYNFNNIPYMLSPTEKMLLKELLALSPVPEQTFSFNELMGYLFGLVITPDSIPASEWMPVIFGEDETGISAEDQARSMSTVLGQIYSTFQARHQAGTLQFPYQLETLEKEELEEVLEWVSGFEEALAMRPDFWEPDFDSTLTAKQQEELFFSIMVVQGLVDPVEILPFFEKLPNEIFSEAFETFEIGAESRELQIQAFLLATLPLSIQTLQNHASRIEKIISDGGKFTANLIKETSFSAPNDFVFERQTQKRSPGKSNVIEVDFRKKKKVSTPVENIPHYQIKIALAGAKPPIWRRLIVPGALTLAELHEVIQVSMGWLNEHLHHFEIDKKLYGPPSDEDWGEESIRNERKFNLHSLGLPEKGSFSYTYDFGDEWQHKITIEKILPSPPEILHPTVTKGKRACPPEDIGGIWGYQEFLEAYTDPTHEDHAAMVEWAGPDFRPELFDKEEIEDINEILKNIYA